MSKNTTFVLAVFVAGLAIGRYSQGRDIVSLLPAANAASQEAGQDHSSIVSPVKARSRVPYFPNSEDLGPDEMRVIALGTGMPFPRPAQAGPGFLVELGNGDKFLFDLGEGVVENLVALQIPWAYLDKVFLGHLHGDHFGDLGALFVSGGLGGRHSPLRVWGPSGSIPELGTAYAVEHLQEAFNWDMGSRAGYVDVRGFRFETHEFDYRGVNEVIFEENGVTIRSMPAIHALDGPVSFVLEWSGLKFVFSSDTAPNKWFDEHARDGDLVIHECFIAVEDIVRKLRADPETALFAGTQAHTAPEAFGKIMSRLQPRMAVAYHFFKDFDTTGPVREAIRRTYDGPLSLAEDFMVWNITHEEIRVRMAVIDEHVWTPPKVDPPKAPTVQDRLDLAGRLHAAPEALEFSDQIKNGRLDVDDVVRPIYERLGEALGREFNYPDPRQGSKD